MTKDMKKKMVRFGGYNRMCYKRLRSYAYKRLRRVIEDFDDCREKRKLLRAGPRRAWRKHKLLIAKLFLVNFYRRWAFACVLFCAV